MFRISGRRLELSAFIVVYIISAGLRFIIWRFTYIYTCILINLRTSLVNRINPIGRQRWEKETTFSMIFLSLSPPPASFIQSRWHYDIYWTFKGTKLPAKGSNIIFGRILLQNRAYLSTVFHPRGYSEDFGIIHTYVLFFLLFRDRTSVCSKVIILHEFIMR